MQASQATPSARRYFQQFSEWEITHSPVYKRLHLRFAAAITLLMASVMWNIFFLIDPEAAKDLWWMFVVATPLCTLLLWRMKSKEQSL
ncbi:MAG: hypothetical protein KIH67_002870 [Candidatus Moranbacteria bacterium]|nr:hypothetical protein [Candidatus Moranbacteria bacterium]